MEMKISYIDEMRSAFKAAKELRLTSPALVVWTALIDLNNAAFWKEWFPVSNSTLIEHSRAAKNTIRKARDELVAHGLISYKTHGRKTTVYRLKRASGKRS